MYRLFWKLVLAVMALSGSLGCGGAVEQVNLKLNELSAKHSVKGVADWLEIYNPSEGEVSLKGLQLIDSNSGKVWDFPANAVIPGKGFLQVVCDDSGTEGRANFKLSAEGETLTLQTSEGQVLDTVTYPPQEDDVSWGRSEDGGGEWKSFANPTPGESNL
ncbi:MAG: lamin tail domain-containing protein [Deltaproteobacteria bacterium]|nr:MAG: lamin tail domain-containing protein [Deltaproteobacteria bacterium]